MIRVAQSKLMTNEACHSWTNAAIRKLKAIQIDNINNFLMDVVYINHNLLKLGYKALHFNTLQCITGACTQRHLELMKRLEMRVGHLKAISANLDNEIL